MRKFFVRCLDNENNDWNETVFADEVVSELNTTVGGNDYLLIFYRFVGAVNSNGHQPRKATAAFIPGSWRYVIEDHSDGEG